MQAAGGDAPGPRIDEPQQEASAEPQQHQQQQQQQAEERPPSPAPSAAPSDMDELLTRMAPKRAGDTADVVLMLVSVTALVALSMQLYRGYLLYQMYADKSF
ncbi:hypothetical protein Rsub_05934 [Raphidocelis subcapitata]|uniref:Uncharacterized protein n=1 Tax=Raphidocelis subcapitata TaxID=307507 RepID=A0A2V0P2S5_9CHLO|nr:hypothetical protein Rsub_05934 [Raphidocelis subcapitata]|eukprot:GBF93202.1 hypothetical protein Rsub_05934 [Raphidocelis subcapitata]